MTVFTDSVCNYRTIGQTQRGKSRDPRWLQVEVCREFSRDRCSRSDEECRYAHPPENCFIEDGKVTACFDAMKDRCQREECKYLHPPDHIKSQLESLGRSFQNTRSRTSSQQSLVLEKLGELSLQHNGNDIYPNYSLPHTDGCYSPATAESVTMAHRMHSFPRRIDKSDKLKVCVDFLNGTCTLGDEECVLAHTPENIQIGPDGFVTVCMDYVKGHCQRSVCRYFHPPSPMVAKVRAAQYRPHHFNKQPQLPMTAMQLPPQGFQMQPPMWLPTYYQQQMLNPAYYPYQPYVGPGIPQAYLVPAMAYNGPSPHQFAVYGGENYNYGPPYHEYASTVSAAPSSPSSSMISSSSLDSNVGTVESTHVQ